MMRRTALFAVILAISILIGIQAVEVVGANPLSLGLPNQGEFGVTIETPSNNTIFKKSNIPLNFTISYTQQWNSYPYWCSYASIASIEVYLDGNLSIQHTSHQVDYYLNGTKTTYARQNDQNNYSDWVNQTSSGQHMLNVTAHFTIQYHDNTMSYSYPKVISKLVYFTVEQQEPSASTMPSSATDLLSNSMPILTIAIVIVIVAVACVSMVYFKRRKGKQ
jgi:cobalamin biosynthesis Mg chelatase CobN